MLINWKSLDKHHLRQSQSQSLSSVMVQLVRQRVVYKGRNSDKFNLSSFKQFENTHTIRYPPAQPSRPNFQVLCILRIHLLLFTEVGYGLKDKSFSPGLCYPKYFTCFCFQIGLVSCNNRTISDSRYKGSERRFSDGNGDADEFGTWKTKKKLNYFSKKSINNNFARENKTNYINLK